MAATVTQSSLGGRGTLTLTSPDRCLEVTYVPSVGMVACSMRHHGEELLGQRGGLEAYAKTGSTFGIPFLHPWANRLDGMRYSIAGREVLLDPAISPLHLDANGLAMHGLLGASPYWEVVGTTETTEAAVLTARLDFGAHAELLAAFPFPHVVVIEATVSDARLTVVTTVEATGDVPVPIAFGYHPYLALPDVPRQEIQIGLAVLREDLLDDRGIPTKESRKVEPSRAPLGSRSFDDLYGELSSPTTFTLEGAGRLVAVNFADGFNVAQVYAPPGEPFICFEPMTAVTNALVTDAGVTMALPGESFKASFSVSVS